MGTTTSAAAATSLLLVAALVGPASAGCFANGTVTKGDNSGDCAALLAAYAAWGNNPASWAPNIAAGASYCGWGAGRISCSNGRVTVLCAARSPSSSMLGTAPWAAFAGFWRWESPCDALVGCPSGT